MQGNLRPIRLNGPLDYIEMNRNGPEFVFMVLTIEGCPFCSSFMEGKVPLVCREWKDGSVYEFPTTSYHRLPSPKGDFDLSTVLGLPSGLVLKRNGLEDGKDYDEIGRVLLPNMFDPWQLTKYLYGFSEGRTDTDLFERFRAFDERNYARFLERTQPRRREERPLDDFDRLRQELKALEEGGKPISIIDLGFFEPDS